MNNQLSLKLRIASFVATLLVVVRHSYTLTAFFPEGGEPMWLNKFEWGTLFFTDVAVPFFFFVSGFFFIRTDYLSVSQYWRMLQKKGRTLLVPFVIWNLAGGLVLLISDNEGNLGDSWQSCFINFLQSKWYGPLWYVRDLMLLMLIGPIYSWLYQGWRQLIICAYVIYLVCYDWWPGAVHLLNGEGILFFLLGGLLQKHQSLLQKSFPYWVCFTLICMWVWCSFNIASFGLSMQDQIQHKLSVAIGIVAFWVAMDMIPKLWHPYMLKLAPYSFLIYVTHFYIQKVMKVILAYIWPNNEIVALVAFLVIPVLLVFAIIVFGKKWQKYLPKTYLICMGGRGVVQ